MGEIEGEVLKLVKSKMISEADYISRSFALGVYCNKIRWMSESEVLQLIDEITGGLGYRSGEFNVMRMGYVGSLIAWPEAIPSRGRVLEIGTGIGRTCYVSINWASPALYITVDKSPEILAIALYRNPVSAFREALFSRQVKICLCDAIQLTKVLVDHKFTFNHVIHDGGPNPKRNPRLFSRSFLKMISKLLTTNGSLSIFAGRDKHWQDKIYRTLKMLGFKIETVVFPDTPTLVFHAVKV